MVTFLDGPAAGVELDLRRAPTWIRVVVSEDGIDALDLLEDQPEPGETVYVYQLAGEVQNRHIDYKGSDGQPHGGSHLWAQYRLHDNQPSSEILRSNALWREWATAASS